MIPACSHAEAVAATLANLDVREYLADPSLARTWKTENLRRFPIVKVEFEHAFIISHLNEAVGLAKPSFGKAVAVHALDENDPVHHSRVLYLYKPSCSYDQNFQRRKAIKARLPKRLWVVVNTLQLLKTRKRLQDRLEARRLGTESRKPDQRQYSEWRLSELREACAILNVTPLELWRAVRGQRELPTDPARQLTLFGD